MDLLQTIKNIQKCRILLSSTKLSIKSPIKSILNKSTFIPKTKIINFLTLFSNFFIEELRYSSKIGKLDELRLKKQFYDDNLRKYRKTTQNKPLILKMEVIDEYRSKIDYLKREYLLKDGKLKIPAPDSMKCIDMEISDDEEIDFEVVEWIDKQLGSEKCYSSEKINVLAKVLMILEEEE